LREESRYALLASRPAGLTYTDVYGSVPSGRHGNPERRKETAMRVHQIEIDDEVFAYLKAKAEAFVDTPNSVLRRELLGGRPGRKVGEPAGRGLGGGNGRDESPEFSPEAPQALRQIVEVTLLVRGEGKGRSEATGIVARRHGVAPQTVLDKYCRQLDLTAAEFDELLREPGLTELRGMLRKKFSRWSPAIESALSSIA
jgi:hypothetical protein